MDNSCTLNISEKDKAIKILQPIINYVESLDAETKEFLIYYTGSGYEDLNRKLRGEEALDDETIKMIKVIDNAFRFAPETADNITVYRGLRYNYNPKLSSYTSTSLDIKTAVSFSGHSCCLLKIMIPAGSKILPLYSISDVSQEIEILMDRIGEYCITSSFETDDYPLTYNVLYIPPRSIIIETIDNFQETQPLLDIEINVSRILNNITEDEIELLGIEDSVYMFAEAAGIPQNAINLAIERLRFKY